MVLQIRLTPYFTRRQCQVLESSAKINLCSLGDHHQVFRSQPLYSISINLHVCCLSVIFNRELKVTLDCLCFTLSRSLIGSKNSRHPLNQSDLKPKAVKKETVVLRRWESKAGNLVFG